MKKLFLLVLAIAIGTSLIAQPVHAQDAPPLSVARSTPLEGPIRVLDRLYIMIGGKVNRNAHFTVQMNGAIDTPGGPLRVVDRMPSEVAEEFQKKIVARGAGNVPVTVHIIARQSREVTLEGAVAFGGKQTILEQTRLSDILKMGMAQPDADLSRITIYHKDNTSAVYDYRPDSGFPSGTEDRNPLLQDNDRIVVPRLSGALGIVRISGEIRDTRRVVLPIANGTTLGQIFQLVGGISEWADRNSIVIERGETRISVPYDEILRNTPGKDIPLQDQDRIVVPRLNRPGQYTVSGAVREGKSYPLTSGLTLPQALLLAGGTADGAPLKRIELRRLKNDGTMTTTLYDVHAGEGRLVEIADGDSLFVHPAAKRKRINLGKTLNLAGSAFFLLGQLGR